MDSSKGCEAATGCQYTFMGEKSESDGSLTEVELDSETSKEPDFSISSGRLDVKV